MSRGNPKFGIEPRTYRFGVCIAAFCNYHDVDFGSKTSLFRQLVRSGTSVGANVAEAQGAQSKADFVNKMAIAHKEAKESRYWLGVLMDSGILQRAYKIVVLPDRERHPQIECPLVRPEERWAPAGYEVRKFGKQGDWRTCVGAVDEKFGFSDARNRLAQHCSAARVAFEFSLLSDAQLLQMEADQICRIIGAIVSSARRNLKSNN